jgi:HSP20 family protein
MSQLVPERRKQAANDPLDTFSDLGRATDRFRNMVDQILSGASPAALVREAGVWVPDVDVEELDDAYVIEAELPGVDRKDVNLELAGNELSITGEIKERERKGLVRHRTRRRGAFELHLTLPERVDGDDVDARFDNGVLTVRVPKLESAQRRQIEVKS